VLTRIAEPIAWAGLWALLVAVALATRPLLPVDETRYLTVAWEMWASGDMLVPHLNGAPYSHKPPLLFWLINLGWQVFGVSELWGRLVAPLFGLGSLFLTYAAAGMLWPGAPGVRFLAPWVLLGSLVWVGATTLSMFDGMLTFFTLTALIGVLRAAGDRSAMAAPRRARQVLGWALFGLGIGLGILSKGPVILVFALPVAVLAPLWLRRPRRSWLAWYAGLLGGLGFGAGVALAWALPAAESGGEAYATAILWGQTSGRVLQSFAHGRPFWWYLPMLLLLLFPWVLWPPLWRAIARLEVRADAGAAFCWVWFAGGLVLLSLISGKQPHYVLPMAPAFALLAARAGATVLRAPTHWTGGLPGAAVVAAGLVIAGAALWQGDSRRLGGSALPEGAGSAVLWLALALVVVGAVSILWRPRFGTERIKVLALQSVAVVIAIHLILGAAAASIYDLRGAAQTIAMFQSEGRAIANVGKYHGQYHFLGRLERPIASIDGGGVAAWFESNPDGLVISYHRNFSVEAGTPVYSQNYRGRTLGIWAREAALTDLERFKR
jgi:4-amino-4-deoxy-L-arabinose transferase-like glycosyltransferase